MADLCEMMTELRLEMKSIDGHFKKVKTLGAGAFAYVELCTVEEEKMYAKVGENVAIKRMRSITNKKQATKESTVLKNLDFPFIVRYLDSFTDARRQFCMVMEHCDYGTLEQYLSHFSVKPFPEFGMWRLIAQFCQALAYMHGRNPPLLHNDLKPSNILCKFEQEVGVPGAIVIKIADFGMSSVLGIE